MQDRWAKTNQSVNGSKPQAASLSCTGCLGIYSSTVIHRHRAKCDILAEKAIPKSRSSLNVNLAKKTDDSFAVHILNHFQDDEVGNICRADKGIISYGKSLYKGDHQDRKQIMGPMRLVGRLLSKYRTESKSPQAKMEDMLKGPNWPCIEKIILASSDNQENLNLNILGILKNVTKVMLADYIIKGNTQIDSEKCQEELNNFLTVLDVKCKQIFAPARQSVVAKRKTVLQKPDQLPHEEDVERLRLKIDEKLLPSYAGLQYKELRRLLVTRCVYIEYPIQAKASGILVKYSIPTFSLGSSVVFYLFLILLFFFFFF